MSGLVFGTVGDSRSICDTVLHQKALQTQSDPPLKQKQYIFALLEIPLRYNKRLDECRLKGKRRNVGVNIFIRI